MGTATPVGQAPRDEGTGLPAVLLALLAPASVVAALAITQQALVAFAVYHLGLCLAAPLVGLRATGMGWTAIGDHIALRSPSREGWAAGGLVGGLTAAGILAGAHLFQDALVHADLTGALAAWGVAGNPALLVAYMLVLNSGAEELLWRGYLHTEAVARLGPWICIGLVSLAFASYHVYTLHALLGSPALVAVGGLAVLAGALAWALLRERYASVVPALLAHGGATAGYMAVYVLLA
jgi:membrane protease YdiL (CAAX protease family)